MNHVSSRTNIIILILLAAISLSSCLPQKQVEEQIRITINVDNETREFFVAEGSTVFNALEDAKIVLGTYDRVDPPSYTKLTNDANVIVTRVRETIKVDNEVIPFERQIIRNEALSEGEERLLQAGQNGVEEITYRVIEEDDNDPYQVVVNRVIIEKPVHEILMIGAKGAFVPARFNGSIAYVSAGNIWHIDGDTGYRSPLMLSGDVDGRVFRLSSDGRWLLFTRSSTEDEETINSLWAIKTQALTPVPVELFVTNVVHFADWSPSNSEVSSTYTFAYSTVEPRPFAPGWQANNDLVLLTIDDVGDIIRRRQILETNPGGQYGWWGTSFVWSPDSDRIAYARPDGIGIIDVGTGNVEQALDITPYQTFGDWAWVPYINWSPDGGTLFFVDHGEPLSLEGPEASQVFHLEALQVSMEFTIQLVSQVGMFSSFAFSPPIALPSGELNYTVAFLQATFPLESARSKYQLILVDRDGSNRRIIFPPPGEGGIEPSRILWSPKNEKLAIIYKKDLWLIDPVSESYQQLTADSQTIAFDWGS